MFNSNKILKFLKGGPRSQYSLAKQKVTKSHIILLFKPCSLYNRSKSQLSTTLCFEKYTQDTRYIPRCIVDVALFTVSIVEYRYQENNDFRGKAHGGKYVHNKCHWHYKRKPQLYY